MSILHDKLPLQTPNLTAQNIDKIAALFPNCITEMLDEEKSTPDHKVYKRGINFELLKQMLSPDVVDGDEAYEFTWVGKKAAMVEANKPIRKTLRPCKEESKDWDTTENLYIEGDNLEVLKLLQESYLGKVKMIYIDPPYNTGHDFVYPDSYIMDNDEYNTVTKYFDEDGNVNYKRENSDSAGKYHSDWCSMIYSRLLLARNLLTEDGVIFISIDDHEVENLKKICGEIFGEQNFERHIHWRRRHNQPNDKTKMIAIVTEHIIVYAKNSLSLKQHGVGKLDLTATFTNPDNDPRGPWASKPWKIGSDQNGSKYTITTPSGKVLDGEWMGDETTYKRFLEEGRMYFPKNGDGMPRKKYYQLEREEEGQCATNWWTHEQFGHNQAANDCMTELFGIKNIFSNPKPVELLRAMMKIANANKNSVILDFFSGSATTAHAVMQLNAEDGGHRKFIMVQLPEPCDEKSEAYKAGYKNICEIGKERIRRAGEKIKSEIDITKNNDLDKMIKSQQSGDKEKMVAFGSTSSRGVLEKKDYTYKDTESGEMRYEDYSKKEAQNLYRFNPDALDVGFRVLKLDDTNMKDVYYAPDDYDQNMLAGLESNIKDDRTDLDLLFGCLIEWGLPLSLPYKSEKIDGCTVHTYNDGDLIACFDANIPESVVKEIAKRKPLRAVFRDSGFASSPEKINVLEIFKAYMPEDADNIKDRVRVI